MIFNFHHKLLCEKNKKNPVKLRHKSRKLSRKCRLVQSATIDFRENCKANTFH